MRRVPSRERPNFTFRLSDSTRALLEAAAARKAEYLAEFIRRAATEVARRELAGDTDQAGR